MINDIEHTNSRTDTATDTSNRIGTQTDHGKRSGLLVRSSVKVGGPLLQHSEAKGLKVRSSVKVGGPVLQHSEAKGLRVRSQVRVGGPILQHSEAKGLRLRTPVGGLSRRVRVGATSAASMITLAVLTVTFELSAGADVVACAYCSGGIKLNHSEASVQRLRTP